MNAFNIVRVVSVFEVLIRNTHTHTLKQNAVLYNAPMLINSNLGTVPFSTNHLTYFGLTEKRGEKGNRNTAETHKTSVQILMVTCKCFLYLQGADCHIIQAISPSFIGVLNRNTSLIL